MLKCTLKKQSGRNSKGLIWLRIKTEGWTDENIVINPQVSLKAGNMINLATISVSRIPPHEIN
jgi:hypothetical protein